MTCPNPQKIQHESEPVAWVHAKSLRRKGASVDVKPYRCGNHWHVGHSKESLGKRIRWALRRNR